MIGRKMSWGTAVRMVQILRSDPSSMLAAAAEGWDHPVSRLEALMMDHWDLTAAAASGGKKAPTYPRQWKVANRKSERYGDSGGRSREEVVTILNALGHHLPV